MHLKIDRSWSDPHVLLWQKPAQILVDRLPHTFRVRDHAKPARFAVPDMHDIGEQIKDCKIVLNDHHGAVRCKLSDHDRRADTLVNVEIWAYLVKEIEIGIPGCARRDCDALELAAAKIS